MTLEDLKYLDCIPFQKAISHIAEHIKLDLVIYQTTKMMSAVFIIFVNGSIIAISIRTFIYYSYNNHHHNRYLFYYLYILVTNARSS